MLAPEHEYTLGELHRHGLGGLARDYAQALALHRLAAAQGLDEAQSNLGFMYLFGWGVAEDSAQALRLFQLAAAQAFPAALFNIAACHENGRGVRKNKAAAIRW
jgi:TPR repeat protein